MSTLGRANNITDEFNDNISSINLLTDSFNISTLPSI